MDSEFIVSFQKRDGGGGGRQGRDRDWDREASINGRQLEVIMLAI